MKEAVQKAYGKVNLGLDVTGVREDGYHLVRMVMQTVSLHDTVTVRITDAPEPEAVMGHVTVEAAGEGSGNQVPEMPADGSGNQVPEMPADGSGNQAAEVPTDGSNLCVRAALLLLKKYDLKVKATIDLVKRIPVAAGMAGGSTDAAAVLRLIRSLCNLPLSDEELEELALPLGADIPYCIRGGTVLCEGIGEEMTRLPEGSLLPALPVLIVKPDFPVSTGTVYRALDAKEHYDHPDIDGLWKGILKESHLILPGNVLEDVTIPLHPEIGRIKEQLMERGAYTAMMSGSGPTVFGLFYNKEEMHRCGEVIRGQKGIESVIEAETLTPGA